MVEAECGIFFSLLRWELGDCKLGQAKLMIELMWVGINKPSAIQME